MIKKSFFILLFLLFSSVCYAADIYVFTADWCPSCVKLKKFIDTNQDVFGGHSLYIIDIDENTDMKDMYQIKKIPTTVVLVNDKETKRKIGFDSTYINWLRDIE